MGAQYQTYMNTALDAKIRGYRPEDTLTLGWADQIRSANTTEETLERIWVRHNRDDRPDGSQNPSLSVGDVVCLDGTYWAVDRIGFTLIDGAFPEVTLTYDEWGRGEWATD